MRMLWMNYRHRVFRILTATLLFSLAGNHVAHAQSADELSAVAKLYPGIDPRNTYYVAPPNNEADYEPYFKNGSSELVVRPVFTLGDGTKTLCQRHPFETAYLYPRTAYTVWLVENWLFQLKKSGVEGLLTSEPGAYFHKYLAKYLNQDSRVNVIRSVDCDSNNEYVFRNLPVGKYILYIYHVNWVNESHERYETQTVMTPDGPHNEVMPGTIEGASHYTDGYIDYTQDAIEITAPNTRSTLDPGIFRTVLHFQEGHD
jgi:hypothetical protein